METDDQYITLNPSDSKGTSPTHHTQDLRLLMYGAGMVLVSVILGIVGTLVG